jgi:hypothetical protein
LLAGCDAPPGISAYTRPAAYRVAAARDGGTTLTTHTKRLNAGLIVAAVACALTATPAGAASPQPYGTNDAGGFRNVLPPGENGLDTASQIATFQATGAYPEHWVDQQPLYNNLIYAAPTLTNAHIPNF